MPNVFEGSSKSFQVKDLTEISIIIYLGHVSWWSIPFKPTTSPDDMDLDQPWNLGNRIVERSGRQGRVRTVIPYPLTWQGVGKGRPGHAWTLKMSLGSLGPCAVCSQPRSLLFMTSVRSTDVRNTYVLYGTYIQVAVHLYSIPLHNECTYLPGEETVTLNSPS